VGHGWINSTSRAGLIGVSLIRKLYSLKGIPAVKTVGALGQNAAHGT